MPDLETRKSHERLIAAVLLGLFDDDELRFRTGGQFSADEFEDAAAPRIADVLAAPYTEAGTKLLDQFAVEHTTINADVWAKRYAKQLAKELAGTTRDRLAELERNSPNFDEDLAQIFGTTRAETIAVTETTRAITAGEGNSAAIIRKTGEKLIVTWYTEYDERVCPICEPLHGTTPRVWNRRFPGGPPAHPRCRCWLEYQ